MNTKLFIGNLSFNTMENDLQDAFAAHGTMTEANLMMDRASGQPHGFVLITMGTPEEAQKAIDALNGATLDGRNLAVNEARPREERSSGGYRGGGGGGVSSAGAIKQMISRQARGRGTTPIFWRDQEQDESCDFHWFIGLL